MKNFEKEYWELKIIRNDFKHVIHKKYPFIHFYIHKIQKSFGNNPVVWQINLAKWENKYKFNPIKIYYKKLTIDKIPEIFDKLIKFENVKAIIFEYLFKGNY